MGQHDGSTARILIAERDRNVRELQLVFLSNAGFTVEFADDGQAALDRVRLDPPSLLITEILIPKIDGLTLCRLVRNDVTLDGMPVIVFSILAAGGRANDAGAAAFLRKPLVESTFLAAINGVMMTVPTTIAAAVARVRWQRLSRSRSRR
ncbi:MAG TPA: response regulator [Gemmatimonadaceae bacterium]|jgi:two-component system response regulator MprA